MHNTGKSGQFFYYWHLFVVKYTLQHLLADDHSVRKYICVYKNKAL